jgi:hypothetical protein
VFISFLLKCHLQAKKQGIEMVLAAPPPGRAADLTALDVWALYDDLDGPPTPRQLGLNLRR